MKTTSIYSTILALAVTSLFSSCAFLQKGEFAQRKYYDFPRTKHTAAQAASVDPKEKAIKQNIVFEEEKKAEPSMLASAAEKKITVHLPFEKAIHHLKNRTTDALPNNGLTEIPALSFKKSSRTPSRGISLLLIFNHQRKKIRAGFRFFRHAGCGQYNGAA